MFLVTFLFNTLLTFIAYYLVFKFLFTKSNIDTYMKQMFGFNTDDLKTLINDINKKNVPSSSPQPSSSQQQSSTKLFSYL